MHRIIHEKKCKVSYALDSQSFVYSSPPFTLKEFINQRLRFASKGKLYYQLFFISNEMKLILPFIFLINLIVVITLFYFCYNPKIIYLLPWFLKTIGDGIILLCFNSIIRRA